MFNPIGWIKPEIAQAHCDIPCGSCVPVLGEMAGQAVQKMVRQIRAQGPTSASEAAKR